MGERWTIYVCPECGAKATEKLLPGSHVSGCSRPEQVSVEVVLASDLERVEGALTDSLTDWKANYTKLAHDLGDANDKWTEEYDRAEAAEAQRDALAQAIEEHARNAADPGWSDARLYARKREILKQEEGNG